MRTSCASAIPALMRLPHNRKRNRWGDPPQRGAKTGTERRSSATAKVKIVRTRYRNGQVSEEQPQLNGRLHGVLRRWHKNGVLALEQPHEHGLTHGICRQWNEDGKLLGAFKIKHGTGVHRHWHHNGQLQSEVSTVHGELTGRHRSWLPDGTLVLEQYYLNNVAVDRQKYEAGRLKDPCLPRYDDKKMQPVAPASTALDLHTHQLFVESLLQKPNQAEATAWLASRKSKKCQTLLGDFKSERKAFALVQRLYAAGAVSVTAVDLYSNGKGDSFCDRLVVELPKDAKRRAAIRQACQSLRSADEGAVSPKSDLGENHLNLLLA